MSHTEHNKPAQEEQLDLIFPYSLGKKKKKTQWSAVQAGLYIKANLDQLE